MNRPRIQRMPQDVLLEILRWADEQTVIALMETCRHLNRYGAKYLLEGGVSLNVGWPKQLWCFSAFLGRDSAYRSPYVESLTIEGIDESEEFGKRPSGGGKILISVLQRLAAEGNLRKLVIEDAEELLEYMPKIARYIARLTTLTELKIANVGTNAAQMLKSSRSHFITVDIAMWDNNDEVEFAGSESDEDDLGANEGTETIPSDLRHNITTHLFPASRQSLVQMYAMYPMSVCCGPRYVNVVYFCMVRAARFRTVSYVHAFPNLQKLFSAQCNNSSSEFVDEEDFHIFRELNADGQQRRGSSWTALRSYSGSLSTLYALAHPHHIRVLNIHCDDDSYTKTGIDVEMLDTVLNEARPTCFSLTIRTAKLLRDQDFLDIWTRPPALAFEHLEFTIRLRSKAGDGDANLSLTTTLDVFLSDIVAPLPTLRTIRFCLDCEQLVLRAPWGLERLSLEEHPLVPIERTLMDWDLGAFAGRLRDSCAMQPPDSVGVYIQGHRARPDEGVQIGPVYQDVDAIPRPMVPRPMYQWDASS
ncbi:hypothetical protein C8Q77DRAFT_1120719 [Trametes polyzona]|nr:hypothetical protein C8Q77DRAFT_1120719 [Trametes polyzona]